MDLRKRLSKSGAVGELTRIADDLRVDKALFKELIEVYIAGPHGLTHRAAHVINFIAARDPHLLRPHLRRIIKQLDVLEVHDAYRRNTIRMLQWIDIPEYLQGRILDLCFKYLLDKKEAIAIRVFSMSVINRIAQGEDSLTRELKLVVEDQLPYAGPAFRSRAKKVLNQMQR
ncbi:MAG: hypothetical protein WKF87_14380 [Chryseolinea sp.]